MKAAVYSRYGPPEVLRIEEVATPTPRYNEVLVRVYATTVSAADWRLRKADPFLVRLMMGLRRPTKIQTLGMEFAGVVESVGEAVALFAQGDSVFGATWFKFGSHAEYVCLPEDGALAMKPEIMSYEEAAAVLFGGVSALSFLKRAKIQRGQKVLVYGASGSVGTAAVQLAKYFGAQVTGVCSGANVELVESLGADAVIDYTREDFSHAGRIYDVILDTVGKSGYWRSMKSLKRGGYYLLVAGSPVSNWAGALWASLTGAAKVMSGVASSEPGDVAFLKGLIEAEELRTVIDRRYRFEEIAEAHRYAEGGHKKGNVVVVVVGQ